MMGLLDEIMAQRATFGMPEEPQETRGISWPLPPGDNRRFHDLVLEARNAILGEAVQNSFWQGMPGMQEYGGEPSIRGPRWYDPEYLKLQSMMMLMPGPKGPKWTPENWTPEAEVSLMELIAGKDTPEDIARMQANIRETSPAREVRESWAKILRAMEKGR